MVEFLPSIPQNNNNNNNKNRAGGVDQVVKYLSSKHEVLSSNPQYWVAGGGMRSYDTF
jgi:hypothetical protein